MIKENVKAILKEKGMTQIDLAEKLNVKQETISRTLSGNPTLKSISDIAKALDVDIRELFISTSDNLNGFIEYENDIYKISSVKDLEDLIRKINKK